MKRTYFILSVLFYQYCNGQTAVKALKYYNEGVNYYNRQDYKKADELFTRSEEVLADKDTYFNRGLCRGKMADKHGYCKDMAYASVFGEPKATALYLKACGTVDTIYVKLDQSFTPTAVFSKVTTYHYKDRAHFRFRQKFYSQQASASESFQQLQVVKRDTTETIIKEEQAEFPGGIVAMMKFMRDNAQMPEQLRYEGFGTYKVFLKFIVAEDGTIHNIEVLKGVAGCPGCDEEATRVIAIMPRWTPAKINGQAVKCYYNIPFSFTIQ